MTMARSNTAFLTTLVIILFLSQTVVAQFENMFNNMFGQQQQQRGGHHHQQQGSEHGVRGWDLQNAAVCWNGHVCSGSASCVVSPKECPCPYPEDYKCFLPEAPVSITKKLHLKSQGGRPSSNTESFVCIRAGDGRSPERECDRVRRMAGGI